MRYEIIGGTLPAVVCHLEDGERMINEGGSMAWMSPNMQMETTGGGFGKAIGRLFSGEKIFQNIYTAEGQSLIAFASSFPGSIEAFDIAPGREIIFQKSSFLAAEADVELSVHFNKQLSAVLFGGEGLFLTRITGPGRVWLQTMPLVNVAAVLRPYFPSASSD